MLCLQNGLQSENAGIQHGAVTEPEENSMASWAAERAVGGVGAKGGVATTKIMSNGEGKIEITRAEDGSETHNYYDGEGNLVASANRSAGYAEHLANGGTLENYHGSASRNYDHTQTFVDRTVSGGGSEISPMSFQFQKTASNWQAAAVSELRMSFQVAGQPGTYKEVSFTIEVGVPIKPKKGPAISAAYAAQISAWAANQTAVVVGGMYAEQYFNPGVSAALPKQFALTMQAFLNVQIPGSRVSSPVISPGLKPTPAIMIESSWWDDFLGK